MAFKGERPPADIENKDEKRERVIRELRKQAEKAGATNIRTSEVPEGTVLAWVEPPADEGMESECEALVAPSGDVLRFTEKIWKVSPEGGRELISETTSEDESPEEMEASLKDAMVSLGGEIEPRPVGNPEGWKRWRRETFH